MLSRRDGYWQGRFSAMAGPCELLIETPDHALASRMLELAANEARRIEQKFSRYRSDNIVHKINSANGQPVELDLETARLLKYADECYDLSGGLFDITSGVLRKAWRFDGSDNLPSETEIGALLARIGWHKAELEGDILTIPVGMEVDLGGIGKEYAVDMTAKQIADSCSASFVVNFGGDLFVSALRSDGAPWNIGLDNPFRTGEDSVGVLKIDRGGVATSGDARRYLLKAGVRYGHILDPRTGWPAKDAPHSVMVVADTCVEAGVFSTVAMLKGAEAEQFLNAEGLLHWCIR